MLRLVPISQQQAKAFIRRYHRHHGPSVGWKFGVGVEGERGLCGVAMVGRPVARHRDDGWTLEVTRLCTDGTPHAASMLYAACWRAAKAMGYTKLGTYILKSETGTSLRAAGWRLVYTTEGGSWDCPSRPRTDKHPTEQKQLWEAA